MKILGIIPARFASTRFPGKPLVDINGKTMIQRVYEQCKKSNQLSDLFVATDDQRIVEEVENFGGQVLLTSPAHLSGTDRCAEIAEKLRDFDIIINIQGDEPFIDPVQIDLLCKCFEIPKTQIATLIKEITDYEELFNENIPKVVINTANEALYFSRNTIPFLRGIKKENWLKDHLFHKHIGIYGFTRNVLLEITKLAPSSLEKAEQLEQLRWVENGYIILTKTTTKETISVDTPEDLEKVNLRFK